MKNVDELYKKYYEAYKSDYDADDKINGTKKKNFHYKQFELVNKTNKELKLDEETNSFIKQIREKEKSIDKKGFSKYFNHEPSALVSKLLGQNTEDF